MYNIEIQSINNFFKIKVNPLMEDFEYATYIYLINKDGQKKIDQIWYQSYNIFTYFYELDNDESLMFSFFIRNKKTKEVITLKTNEIKKNIPLSSIDDINFESDFEVEVLSDWIIPIKYQKSTSSKKHIILLNGALKDKKIYPLYNRVTWKNRFNKSILNIYDATISLQHEMTLGWYRGTLNNPILPCIHKIIKKLQHDKNLSNEDLIFYGSSGGGWSALKLAEAYPGSTAVSINPQINILDYGIKRSVDLSIKNSFNNIDETTLRKLYKNEISINPQKFIPNKSKNVTSKFILVQNIQDTHHYNEHFIPFWKNFSTKIETGPDRFNQNYALIYDHISGHAGEPPEIFDLIMKII